VKNEKTLLKSKSVLLGITGGIASYKSIELTRRLTEEGASVTVIMTDAAQNFITPLTFEVTSGNKVYTDLYSSPMAHISLPAKADIMLVAPATADIIGKFAHGIANDLLSTCFLAYRGRTVIAPSMNWRMYENPAVQDNLKTLGSRGVVQVGPVHGSLACQEEGTGRMSDVMEIIHVLRSCLSDRDLSTERLLVTAGPTREYIDPLRFISNRSSGKMGYALAEAAYERGAQVTLISGYSNLPQPSGVKYISVDTAADMLHAINKEIRSATVFIMCAAVSDFTPESTSPKKIKKQKKLLIRLAQTPDILSIIGSKKRRPFIIGFAAETGQKIKPAQKKFTEKNMDMIVFNDVTETGAGFDSDTNKVTLIDRDKKAELPIMTKYSVAHAILDRMIEMKT
jgi:phosphopantothenoylcysteine decarboxylase/phosphopantothenate--cysteine ligase